jgi:hypothetical protein
MNYCSSDIFQFSSPYLTRLFLSYTLHAIITRTSQATFSPARVRIIHLRTGGDSVESEPRAAGSGGRRVGGADSIKLVERAAFLQLSLTLPRENLYRVRALAAQHIANRSRAPTMD